MTDSQSLIDAVRKMPWKSVVKIVKEAVREQPLEELPAVVLEWFDLNRSKAPDAAMIADLTRRLGDERVGLADRCERAPIGAWWISMLQYLRDGKRWIFFAAHRDDGADAMTSTGDEMRRLHKIVDYAGGDAKRMLIDAGETLIWTWRA